MSKTTTWNPDSYAKNARFVSDLGEPVLELLAPQPSEWILDLGCGDGALTKKIAAAGSNVIGTDTSVAQLHSARARDLNVFAMDGQRLGLKLRFDAVFTNAALHWMKSSEDVVKGVAACLKAGGRFVGEFGSQGNVEKIRAALHAGLRRRGIDPWTADPWYYPSPKEYAELLTKHRFTMDYIELIPRPTKLLGDILGWLEVFAQPFTKSVGESERSGYLEDVKQTLEPALRDSEGNWIADYVRLRFKAIKQPA